MVLRTLHKGINIFVIGYSVETASRDIIPFTSKSDQLQISPAAFTRNITSHSMKNLAFHCFTQMQGDYLPILTT